MASPRLIASILIALLVAGLDASILNVMLPELKIVFKTTTQHVSLLVTVYVTLLAALGLPLGRLADVVSPVRLFAGGVLLFGLGSLVCGLSGSLLQILTGRCLQGLGGAVLSSSFGAVVLRMVDKDKTGGVIGQALMVISVGGLLGPPLGGWFAETLSWHWAFFINVPLCFCSFVLLLPHLKESVPPSEPITVAHFDPWGSLFVGIFMVSLPAAFFNLAEKSAQSIEVAGPLFVAVVAVTLYVRNERRARHPLTPPALFFTWDTALIGALKVALFMAFNGIMLVYPFFINSRPDFQLNDAGWMMVASALAMTLSTSVTGKLSDRFGTARMAVVGSLFFLLSSIFSLLIPESPSRFVLVLSLALVGLSIGSLSVTGSVMFLKLAPLEHSGVFSAVNSLMAPVGAALGYSLYSILYGNNSSEAAGFAGFRHSAQATLLFAFIIVFVCTILLSKQMTKKTTDQEIDRDKISS